jgi:uncharacterized protein (DUF58 family)
MIRPTPRALVVLAAGIPVSLLPAVVSPALWPAAVAWNAGALLLLAADLALSLPSGALGRTLAVPRSLSIGVPGSAAVRLHGARARRATPVTLLLDVRPGLLRPPPTEVRLPARGDVEARLPLVATRRGSTGVERLWARWTGPLGLLSLEVSEERSDAVVVLPDAVGARHAALAFEERPEFRAGLKTVSYVGEGSEFDAMREHVAGMDARAISWRASARHRRLIAHEFRAERNHQVIVALDCGRLMGDPLGGVPKIDHAVRAGLALAHVALRSGDRVGMYTFDEGVRGWSPPRGGTTQHAALRAFAATVEYGGGETNFTLGLAELSARLRRRSLVVLLTDFVDTVTAELMLENVAHLARRHLLLFVALEDRAGARAARAEPTTVDALHRAGVADDLRRERDRVLRSLQRLGVLCLEAPPEHVGARLLSRYLEVKRRERIG